MPTIPSIRTSVENKALLVLDEHAKKGAFKKDARDRLIAYSGGFSVVFPYQTISGEKWAFRCWHADVNISSYRYEIISEAINKVHLDCLCEFKYIEKGINVEGKIYPTTRMRWVDGITIKDYICQNKDSKELLKALAENFLQMTQALHGQSLAHGDLQHGNILVTSDHHLYLVDYDSFYCPKLKGEADTVTGLPDYQHPSRISNKSVSEKLDYFSELIIYLSICAIAENPSLVSKYQVEDADRMLFSKDDYADLKHSQIYQDISALGEDYIDLLDVLEEYLQKQDINELQPFNEVLQEKKIVFRASATKAIRNKQKVSVEWNVLFDGKVRLNLLKSINSIEVQRTGQYNCNLTEDEVFELEITSPNGKAIKKRLSVYVFDECEIEFSADKYNVFPTIPVTLTWDVKHANRIWLDNEEVNTSGKKVIEPQKATTCVLSAEDEFGIKEKRIEIQMLPVPIVKSIMAPTPNFVSNLSVTIQQPRYNVDVKFPQMDIGWIKTEVPKVKSLTDLGLNVDLTSSSPKPSINIMRTIKKCLNK